MNILVLHNVEDLRKTRRSILDYMFAFQRYQPGHNYLYHRISDPPSPELRSASWDAVILESTALGISTFRPRELFSETIGRWSFLADEAIVKVVFPQDDANHSGVMDDWFADWGVQYVFSVRPEHKAVLYPKSSRMAEFRHCFAGYIDDASLPVIETFSKPWNKRTRLLGQRVTMYPYRGGRQGRLKGLVALQVKAAAAKKKIAVDISVDPKDTLFGDAWFEFLGDCKYVLASEGGLSLLDPYGEIQDRINAYLKAKPDASFEEVEAACFPGLDGKHVFEGFSPRILEAAVCGASQVLVEGHYRGLLEAGRHYLPLKADCSNVDDVLRALKDEDAAQARVAACNETLVRNPAFRYSTLATQVIKLVKEGRPASKRKRKVLSPASARRAYTQALVEREAAIGFQWGALADRVGGIVAAQSADPVFRSGTQAADVSRIEGSAASVRALAIQAAAFAAASGSKGAVGDAFGGLARGFEHIASLTEVVSDLAHALHDSDATQDDLSAAASALESVAKDITGFTQRLSEATPGAAGLMRLLGADAAQAEAAAELAGPELENRAGQLTEEGLSKLARISTAFRRQDRAAQAMSVLAHKLPDDASALLDLVAPVSAETGGWYSDDLERLRQARVVLGALESGGDRARLLVAIAGLDESATGIASRLAPASGDVFGAADAARLAQLDRILVRASSRSGSLDLVEQVQEGGADLESLLTALGEGGDRARLLLAIAAAGSGTTGIVSRLAPATSASFSPAEITRLEQLDRILVRAAGEPQALDYLEKVQQAGDEARSLFAAVAKGGDAAQLIKALAAAGPRIVGFASRIRPGGGAEFSPGELARLEQIDRILVRSAAGRITLEQLEHIQSSGLDVTNLLGLDETRLKQVNGIFESDYLGILTDLAAKGPQAVELASRVVLNGDNERMTLVGALIDLTDSHGRAADFLKALSFSRRQEALELLGSLAPAEGGSPDWTQQQANSFQALTAIVGTLDTDLPESGAPEQNWQLLHDVAKLVVRAPRRRALIQAIVGRDTKGRRP